MLEVCVDSIESAIAADEGCASRIELCSVLSEGGLTPTAGTLKALKTDINIKIPIFCMLRPRRGNDFQFSPSEILSLLYDIQIFREYGCDGFVFGALDASGSIDADSCKRIVEGAGDLPVTFHRAFDMTDPRKMLAHVEVIKQLGFKRILTSGFESTADKGINNLKKLVANSSDLIIMPGSGINSDNLESLLLETECKEFHASARTVLSASDQYLQSMSMGGGREDAAPRQVTSTKLVRELANIAKGIR